MTRTGAHGSVESDGRAAGANGSPDVSFVVAAYNAAPFVQKAVQSALSQTHARVEVIVVDDASSDGTPDVVAAMAEREPGVRLLRRSTRAGPSIARNTAMAEARGTWLAILDADDFIEPQRTLSLLDLAAATSADVVADNFQRFETEEHPAGTTMIPSATEPYAFFVDVASFLRGNVMFHRRANLGYVKPMFRTAFIREHGLRHKEDIFIGEDYHLCLSCLLAGARFVVTSQSFYRYRTRRGSLSWRITRAQLERLRAEHANLRLEQRYAGDARSLAAADAYARALDQAMVLSDLIDDAKRGGWAAALATAAAHPDIWPLAARFGSAAALKRLGLRS